MAAPPTASARDDAMAQALVRHRAGRPGEAAALYAAILATNPSDADALHLSGVAADAQGDPARAAALIGQAIALRGDAAPASYHSNLGMALGHLGRHEEALESYARALAIRPDYPEALSNQGVSFEALRRPADAEAAYRRAVILRPAYPEGWTNLGNTLRGLGRLDEAAEAYRQALAHNEAQHAGGQHAGGRADAQAGAQSGKVAGGAPPGSSHDRPDALANLGLVLQQLGRLEESAAACRRAVAARPDYQEAWNTLGNVLRELGRLAESEAALRRAVALRPTDTGTYNNLAITLSEQDRPHEALAVLDLAAGLQPDDAETGHHRAMLLLRQGRFREGWEAYEHRFRTKQAGGSYEQFEGQPRWRGEPLDGRTVLLVPEQGHGDQIQFARYAPLVAERGGRVVLGAHPGLARLFRTIPGVAQVVGAGEALPSYDLHVPLLSLPALFGTTLDSVPAAAPYLSAEPEAAARWAARQGVDKGTAAGAGEDGQEPRPGPPPRPRLDPRPDPRPPLRVGVAWAGNPGHLNDRQRSVPFAALAPLWSVPGVRWFSLQVGPRAAELRGAPALLLPPGGVEDLSPDLSDFAETAAALAGLDLLVTADTAVAHLAGALGCPVWVLLPAVPDWRWLRAGDRSPWYPTLRLFRQDRTGDGARRWPPVLERVAAALRGYAGG